jgi:regulator of protease activity HflC (stomatin/prohibitin superfamily)
LCETFRLPLPERAERYRAQAHEIRVKAVNYPAEIRAAFFKIALCWEQLALEAEAKHEKQAAASPQDTPPLRASKFPGKSAGQAPA